MQAHISHSPGEQTWRSIGCGNHPHGVLAGPGSSAAASMTLSVLSKYPDVQESEHQLQRVLGLHQSCVVPTIQEASGDTCHPLLVCRLGNLDTQGQQSDLTFIVQQQLHPAFRRLADDLYAIVDVPLVTGRLTGSCCYADLHALHQHII